MMGSEEKAYLERRRQKRLRLYNVNSQQLAQLEAIDACQLCGLPSSSTRCLHIDHVHDDNDPHVRGVLCSGCNTGIGHVERFMHKGILKNAIAWIERWND